MNILIYDPNVELVKCIIDEMNYLNRNQSHLSIYGTSDVNDLIEHVRRCVYDIAYLDMKVDYLTNCCIIDDIKLHNTHCLIVLMCEDYKYVYDLFDCRIFHYLYKPVENHQFKVIFTKILELFANRNEIYTFNTSIGKKEFLVHDILYIETYYDYLKIVTLNKAYYSHIKNNKKIKNKLQSHKFIQIHQSYFVNLLHIDRIDKNTVILKNGIDLPVSTYKKKEVKNLINQRYSLICY